MSIPEPSLTPPERPRAAICAFCGEDIQQGELAYSGDEGLVHDYCVLPLMLGKLSADYIATACGYRATIAGVIL